MIYKLLKVKNFMQSAKKDSWIPL